MQTKAYKKGFSLIEVIIAMGIFASVLLASVGVIINVSVAQNKTVAFRRVQDNARFALEYMTKEIRTGRNFTAGGLCSGGWCSQLTLCTDRGHTVRYGVSGGAVTRTYVGTCATGAVAVPNLVLTSAEEMTVSLLRFRLVGNIIGPSDGQPMVTIRLRGFANVSKVNLQTDMNFQTSVTQRFRDY